LGALSVFMPRRAPGSVVKRASGKVATMKTIFCATGLVGAILLSSSANAGQCGPKQMVTEQLGDRYGEVTFASGVVVDNSVKFFGNPQTGTWSMVVIRPDGLACVIATGEGLEVVKPAFAEGAYY
jgi:hypothetical protein